MGKKGTLYGIAAKLATMSPEDKKEFYRLREIRRRQIVSSKKEEVYEWKQETLKMVTSKIKELSLDFADPNTQISQAVLWTIHDLLKRGFTVTELRDRILGDGCTNHEGWNRIKKAVFGDGISKLEDIGIDVFTSQVQTRDTIQRQIRYLEKMKKRRPDDPKIPGEIAAMVFKLHEVERSLMRDLGAIGVVGEKNKKASGTIHIHTHIPRPPQLSEKSELLIDISPIKEAISK